MGETLVLDRTESIVNDPDVFELAKMVGEIGISGSGVDEEMQVEELMDDLRSLEEVPLPGDDSEEAPSIYAGFQSACGKRRSREHLNSLRSHNFRKRY